MLLVTGGSVGLSATDYLSTTEVMTYSSGKPGSWRFAGQLPSPRLGLRGVTLGQGLYVTGGFSGSSYYDSIVSWSGTSETWALAGNLTVGRTYHGLASPPLAHLQGMGYCN